jgi:hypothetical protein
VSVDDASAPLILSSESLDVVSSIPSLDNSEFVVCSSTFVNCLLTPSSCISPMGVHLYSIKCSNKPVEHNGSFLGCKANAADVGVVMMVEKIAMAETMHTVKELHVVFRKLRLEWSSWWSEKYVLLVRISLKCGGGISTLRSCGSAVAIPLLCATTPSRIEFDDLNFTQVATGRCGVKDCIQGLV